MTDSLEQRIKYIEDELKKLNKTVSWNDNVSDSGITLTGSGLIPRTGQLIGTQVMPVGSGQFMVIYVVQSQKDNKIIVLNAADCTLL